MTEDLAPDATARLAKPVLAGLIDDILRAAENETADGKRKHMLEILVVGYHIDLRDAASLDCTQEEADELRRKVLLIP